MKIIQLLSVTTGEDGSTGSDIYGLGDDGCVYELVNARPPRKKVDGYTGKVTFYDGCTGGWVWHASSQCRNVPTLHPEDPKAMGS